jgi:hypothetical protein
MVIFRDEATGGEETIDVGQYRDRTCDLGIKSPSHRGNGRYSRVRVSCRKPVN